MKTTQSGLALALFLTALTMSACDAPAGPAPRAAPGVGAEAAPGLPEAAIHDGPEDAPDGALGTSGIVAPQEEDGMGNSGPGNLPLVDAPAPPPRATFTDVACEFDEWIGKPVDDAVIKATGRHYRIMTPDDMMTMDMNPTRINVIHNDGKVMRVWCG